MSFRLLVRVLGVYAVLLAMACGLVRAVVSVGGDAAHPREVLASVWQGGELRARASVAKVGDQANALELPLREPGATLVYEQVLDEGPILTFSETAFALSLVAARDGVKAYFRGKTAYVTPDDLLARQGYDRGHSISELALTLGADVPLIYALLGERLDATVPDVMAEARIRRIRVARFTPEPPPNQRITADTLDADAVRQGVVDAARFLARGVRPDGHFRYLIEAPTNRDLPGYEWPRHAGATYFLAQAWGLTRDPMIGGACLRAARLLRGEAMARCGDFPCIAKSDNAEIGSSSLAIMAFSEMVERGLDTSLRPTVIDLARFLRAQQRPDGEFQHVYDREARRPIDVQFLYFSGEASLALARAYRVTHDPQDRDAASRGLAHLVGPAWHFFGDRYYFGEEHWTCQVAEVLWDEAPNPAALDFCLRWHAYSRGMQYGKGETSYDADGAFGVGPILTPRLTPVGSRSEAAVATLITARRAGAPPAEVAALEKEIRHALALLLRQQFRPGPTHLFADPEAVYGAMPGSAVDWQLRIDYAQHAGSAMVRYVEGVGGR